ncbi:MAG TPA: peptidoglycan DD-metalloendopeptidase family protein [Steroidobacteraceae bacterium]|nr:peptidoglycan DD-metalloendopeptidase family protein [Steroidobacteraceae bacterium]
MRAVKYGAAMARGVARTLTALTRSPIAWLQAGVLAVLAWGWVHGSADHAATAGPRAPIGARAAGEVSRPLAADSAQPAAPRTVQSTFAVKVGRDDTLERIFRRLRLSLGDLATLRALPGLKEDLDRLRPGEALTFITDNGVLLGLTRRLNLEHTLKVVRGDSGFHANVVAIPLEMRTRTVSGHIDSSLFEAVNAAGADDQTALALADIFAWDIDFLKDIQPGDAFAVTYQQVYESGKYVQDGPVLAARFVNQGHEYLAVRYVAPDGRADYYTPEGRSLRKAFLRAPLAFTRVSSPFSLHRRHPILNLIRAHKGVDYAAPIGTPVHAAGDGRVVFAGRKGGYGNLVEIQHSGGIMTVYGHLSRFARGTRVGERVEQNQVIAYVGMTGLATGPHLHFEFRVNGVYKDPQTVKLPEAVPIEARLRAEFLAQTSPLVVSLFPPIGPALVAR